MFRRKSLSRCSLFWAEQRGAAMIEYSVLITIVAACVFVVAFGVAAWTNGALTAVKDAMLGAPVGPAATTSAADTGGGVTPAVTSGSTIRGNGKGNNGNGKGNGGPTSRWAGGPN